MRHVISCAPLNISPGVLLADTVLWCMEQDCHCGYFSKGGFWNVFCCFLNNLSNTIESIIICIELHIQHRLKIQFLLLCVNNFSGWQTAQPLAVDYSKAFGWYKNWEPRGSICTQATDRRKEIVAIVQLERWMTTSRKMATSRRKRWSFHIESNT